MKKKISSNKSKPITTGTVEVMAHEKNWKFLWDLPILENKIPTDLGIYGKQRKIPIGKKFVIIPEGMNVNARIKIPGLYFKNLKGDFIEVDSSKEIMFDETTIGVYAIGSTEWRGRILCYEEALD